jgi:Kef-type K+ transport system membrane component KefB
MTFQELLVQLILVFAVAKIGSELADRVGQPPVLGELIGGILAGAGALHWLRPHDVTLHALAEIGAILLLFEVGLESDLPSLMRVGPAALWVAVAGVTLPFAMGYGVSLLFGLPPFAALFIGAALTATSVGITARVFGDLGALHRKESRIVLGAAVADDVIGLIILAVISGLAGRGGISAATVVRVVGLALLFLVGSILVGERFASPLLHLARRMRSRGTLCAAAVGFCFALAVLAAAAGLAPIVGAFAAGLVLARTEHRVPIEPLMKPLADLFIPVFFVMMGASTELAALSPATPVGREALALGGALAVVAIVGKVLGGLTCPGRGVDRWVVGLAMIPRGEVGLIFAGIGREHGILNPPLYAAILGVILLTTLVTPPALKRRLHLQGVETEPASRQTHGHPVVRRDEERPAAVAAAEAESSSAA